MPNLCSNCNQPAEFSNSPEHPEPHKNQWLCRKCYNEVFSAHAETKARGVS